MDFYGTCVLYIMGKITFNKLIFKSTSLTFFKLTYNVQKGDQPFENSITSKGLKLFFQ